MKKLISLLLVLAMALTLAACGGSNAPAATDAPKADAPAADAPAAASKTKISVFWYDESDVYLSSVRTALNKELDALGVTYDNQYAANDQAKQIDQTCWSSTRSLPALPIPLRTSWLLPVISPSSSSTVPSAPTAPSCLFWRRTLPLASSAPTLPPLATCRAR